VRLNGEKCSSLLLFPDFLKRKWPQQSHMHHPKSFRRDLSNISHCAQNWQDTKHSQRYWYELKDFSSHYLSHVWILINCIIRKLLRQSWYFNETLQRSPLSTSPDLWKRNLWVINVSSGYRVVYVFLLHWDNLSAPPVLALVLLAENAVREPFCGL